MISALSELQALNIEIGGPELMIKCETGGIVLSM